jgi:hypothetical protein
MNDPFATRVRAAAVAAWWTVLIAIGFTVVLSTVYYLVMSYRPAWWLILWGPDVGWPEVQHIMLRVIVAFKFVLWLLLLAVVWLTLWGRQLRK